MMFNSFDLIDMSPEMVALRRAFHDADKAARAGKWEYSLTVDRAVAYCNLLAGIQAKRGNSESI